MICREQGEAFVMVKQHDHGLLSGELAKWFREERCHEGSRRQEVLWAVAQHDRGWIDLDETPFWNDTAEAPYTFVDFPVVPKLTFYRRGLDEIEATTPYGALLCSLHFERLIELSGEEYPELTLYQEQERIRRSRIRRDLESVAPISEQELQYDSQLLKFCDDLSLYLALNKPGCDKDEMHPWWKGGFAGSEELPCTTGQRIIPQWMDCHTLVLDPLPFSRTLELTMKQRVVTKSDIRMKGLAGAYKDTPEEELRIAITGPVQA